MWQVEISELVSDVARVRLPPGGGAGAGSFGSGRLVAPGLVLTARHVLETEHREALPDTGWEVRFVGSDGLHDASPTPPFAARVVWRGGAGLDIALLTLIESPSRHVGNTFGGPRNQAGIAEATSSACEPRPTQRRPRWVRFGQVTATQVIEVRVTGFPEVLWSEDFEPEPYCFPAELSVSNLDPVKPYWLAVQPAHAPRDPKGWKGLSGAAVHSWVDGQPCLLGVIEEVPRGFDGSSLRVARFSAAWQAEDFRKLLQTSLGSLFAPQLVVASPPSVVHPQQAVIDLALALSQLVSSPETLAGTIRALNSPDRPSSPNVQGKIVGQVIERLAHPERDSKRVRELVDTCINLMVKTCGKTGDETNLRQFLNLGSELTPFRMLEEMRRVRRLEVLPAPRAELGKAETRLCLLMLDFEAAHAAAERTVRDCPDDLEALRLTGLACMRVSRFIEARRFYAARLKALESSQVPPAIDLAEALIDLAGACDEMFLLDESETLLRRALGLLETSREPQQTDLCRSMALNNLGGTLLAMDDPAAAKGLLVEAVQLRREGGDAPFNLAISLVNLAESERLLGDSYAALGRLEQARQVVRRAYAHIEQRLSLPPHILLAKVQNELGTLKTIDFEKPDEGMAELREALRIYELNGLSIYNYDVMIATFNLGIACQRSRRYEDALHHVRRAAAACREILPLHHPVRQAIELDEKEFVDRQVHHSPRG
jgi:tetratricopeptide (TPR) repeat protein